MQLFSCCNIAIEAEIAEKAVEITDIGVRVDLDSLGAKGES